MSAPKTLSALAVLLVGIASAQDGPKVEAVRSRPSLGEYPPPPQAKPVPPPKPQSPDEPRPLDVNKVRMFWVEDYESDIPVRWLVIPLDKTAVVDSFAVGTKPVFIAHGDDRAKEHVVPDGAKSPVQVWGVAKGRVLLQADGVKGKDIVTLFKVTIEVGGPQSPQPPPGGGDPPGGGEPPTKPVKAHFLTVRPDGPATADFVLAFSNQAWAELKAAGHTVKELTLTESQKYYRPPSGTPIPYTVTLDAANSKVLAGPVPMPTDSTGIRKLAEGLPK